MDYPWKSGRTRKVREGLSKLGRALYMQEGTIVDRRDPRWSGNVYVGQGEGPGKSWMVFVRQGGTRNARKGPRKSWRYLDGQEVALVVRGGTGSHRGPFEAWWITVGDEEGFMEGLRRWKMVIKSGKMPLGVAFLLLSIFGWGYFVVPFILAFWPNSQLYEGTTVNWTTVFLMRLNKSVKKLVGGRPLNLEKLKEGKELLCKP